jgi:hypothetical protein
LTAGFAAGFVLEAAVVVLVTAGLSAIKGMFPASTPVPAAVVGVVTVLGVVGVVVVGVVTGCVCTIGSGIGAVGGFKTNQPPTLPKRASNPTPKSIGVETLGRFMPCFLAGAV